MFIEALVDLLPKTQSSIVGLEYKLKEIGANNANNTVVVNKLIELLCDSTIDNVPWEKIVDILLDILQDGSFDIAVEGGGKKERIRLGRSLRLEFR